MRTPTQTEDTMSHLWRRIACLLGVAMVLGPASFTAAQSPAPAAAITEAEAQAIAVDAYVYF